MMETRILGWAGVLGGVTCCIVLFKVAIFLLDLERRKKTLNLLPSRNNFLPWSKRPWGYFLLRDLADFPGPNEEGLTYMRERLQENSKAGLVWHTPFIPRVTIGHPTCIKTIMTSKTLPKPTIKLGPNTYGFILPWLGRGLLLANGNHWARSRRLLTPAFHFEILKSYMDIYNNALDIATESIEECSGPVEVFNMISLLTLDIMLKCACSLDFDIQRKPNDPYISAITRLNQLLPDRFLRPWLHNDWIYKLTPSGREFFRLCDFVHQVSENVIKERRHALEHKSDESRRHKDFLDILLSARDEHGEGMSDLDIRNEVDTFLFEGHDTTASALSWTLHTLAEHPEYRHRCQKEVDAVFAGKQYLCWDDLGKLPYLTQCLKESMRLHSPVPYISRTTVDSSITLQGVTLEPGTDLDILTYMVHHNPDYWPDSMKFDPERFSPENVEKMDPFAFIPFSAGQRNCIGQNFAMNEMKTTLATLLHRFEFESAPGHPVRKRVSLVMKAENGIHVNFKRRNT